MDYGCGAGEFVKYIENDFETFVFEPDADARKAAKSKITKAAILDDISKIEDKSE